MNRQRLTWAKEAVDKEAARAPSGLYGFTRRIQADCETAVRKLNKHASLLAKAAYQKDERVAVFLQTHSKRTKSNSAGVLLAAMREMGPKIGSGGKIAAGRVYGLYGYPSNTVKLGLAICAQLREKAGLITADLHGRRSAKHARITEFLTQHSKAAKCMSSRILSASYPDEDASYARRASEIDKTASPVDTWLAWDMSELDTSSEHYG